MHDDTHSPMPVTPISGYRALSPAELDAINRIKAVGNGIGVLLDEVAAMPGIDLRALAIARTELQTGFMWLTRAIARPDGF
jgi:hypothetical protein